MNKIINWLGQEMEFSGNLSLAIAKHEITNFPADYIYEDDFFNITADPEIPIKGYVIIGIDKPINSIVNFEKDREVQLVNLIERLLNAMHKSGYKKVMTYQDESSSEYFHLNFIPRFEWMNQFHTNFGEMGVYAKEKLNINDKYKEELLEAINLIKKNFI